MTEQQFLLRPLTREDLPTRVKWMNDERIFSSMNYEIPIILEKTEEWFKKAKNDNNRKDYVLEKEKTIMAMTGIIPISNNLVEVYVFSNPYELNKGIGTICQFLSLAKNFHKKNKLEVIATIDEDNIPSRKLYEKLGFYKTEIAQNQEKKNGHKKTRITYSCKNDTFSKDLFKYKIKSNTAILIL